MEKVILKDFRAEKTIKLPASGITVTYFSSLLVGDLAGITKAEGEVDRAVLMLSKMIKEWNFFAGENEKSALPISAENIKKLPAQDLIFLSKDLESFQSEEKKT